MAAEAAPPAPTLADGVAEVAVDAPELLGAGFRKYQRFRYRAAPGEAPQARDVLCTGAVAAVLPLDLDRDEVVLLRQFRLPAHLANGKGDLLEIVAGHVEANESAIETARRECCEEIGVTPSKLIELFSYLTSPGTTDEQITLFLGIVDAAAVPQRAGVAGEHEQTLVMRVPIGLASAALAHNAVRNGPLVLALQWLALNRGRLREIAAGR
jgi:ADP-ribose pyrophosphatase